MTIKEYEEFGRPYDLQILNALPKNWWLNVMHLHGPLPMFHPRRQLSGASD